MRVVAKFYVRVEEKSIEAECPGWVKPEVQREPQNVACWGNSVAKLFGGR